MGFELLSERKVPGTNLSMLTANVCKKDRRDEGHPKAVVTLEHICRRVWTKSKIVLNGTSFCG